MTNPTDPNRSAVEPRAASPERALRRLFLTLFLRGRSSRGLQKSKTPKSIGRKLLFTLLFYAAFGCMAFLLAGQPIFLLSAFLHAMTFVFLGMFVASSAGEILFNREEADILLHRPVAPKQLLWAKAWVLVQVSVWLAAAFNLAGFFVGIAAPGRGWLFPLVHAVSVTMEAIFCTGCIVVVYQLCLRWFGRERLDGLMTTAQVIVSIAAVLSGQILPQLVARTDSIQQFGEPSWWIWLLPPAWFAGFDDALAGTAAMDAWGLAGLGVVATALVCWLAFAKLAQDYEVGLQLLNENVGRRSKSPHKRRRLERLIGLPPLRWWLREPVARASFLLTAAYLVRDRDVKLRVYPGLAPILLMPILFLLPGGRNSTLVDGIGFAGAYVGLAPLMAINILQYSQQWRAADIFRTAPLAGPAPLCHGARRAVLCFFACPLILIFAGVGWFTLSNRTRLLLLLPGVISLPIYAMAASLASGVPLSVPPDEAKAGRRGLMLFAMIFASLAVGGIAEAAWYIGWFWWFVLAETVIVAILYAALRLQLQRVQWAPLE